MIPNYQIRKKYLLTYSDANAIVNKYNGREFRKKEYMINGYKVVTYDYFLVGYNDFLYPLGKNSKVTAFDMRGTTFVFDKKGNVFETFYMLPKFFNINQIEETQYEEVKNKKILNIAPKEDGSLIGFFRLPDRTIHAKTIGSFVSDQAIEAKKIIDSNKELRDWINLLLNMNATPLFEYVSYDNRIVLKYNKKELRFIGVRDNIMGYFYPSFFNFFDPDEEFAEELINDRCPIRQVWSIRGKLDDLIELSKVEKDKEGWVIMFEDGQLMKVKTEWYFNNHGLRTEYAFREDYIIEKYLDEELDDIITQFDPATDKDALDFIEKVTNAVNNFYKKINSVIDVFNAKLELDYNNNFKEFAKNHYHDEYFGLFSQINKNKLDGDDYNQYIKEYILKKTIKLKRAQEFVKQFNYINHSY